MKSLCVYALTGNIKLFLGETLIAPNPSGSELFENAALLYWTGIDGLRADANEVSSRSTADVSKAGTEAPLKLLTASSNSETRLAGQTACPCSRSRPHCDKAHWRNRFPSDRLGFWDANPTSTNRRRSSAEPNRAGEQGTVLSFRFE